MQEDIINVSLTSGIIDIRSINTMTTYRGHENVWHMHNCPIKMHYKKKTHAVRNL